MIRLSVSADVKALQRTLNDFAQKQLRFAVAKALTDTARQAADAENAQIKRDLDRPTPFTQRAVRAIPATKATWQARVLVQDVQAKYLAPEINGGYQVLGKKRGIITPKDIKLNAYGNIPRGRLARLKNQPDVFIGPVTFRSGQTINGVWKRPRYGVRRDGTRGSKGNSQRKVDGLRTGLQLLIRFTDPVEVKTRLPFGRPTRSVVGADFDATLRRALRRALATTL